MINFRDLFRRQKKAGQVHIQSKPELDADHEHDILELPTDMGRKVLRMCRTEGCKFSETVARKVRGFQKSVLDDVLADLGQRRKHR